MGVQEVDDQQVDGVVQAVKEEAMIDVKDVRALQGLVDQSIFYEGLSSAFLQLY